MRKILVLALPLAALLGGQNTPAQARRVPTPTPTHAPTRTPTPTPTHVPTKTPTPAYTASPTASPTLTATVTNSSTATATATPASSVTPAPTATPSPVPSSGYNGATAAAYADQYWSAYNPQWPSYANSGGDCTNFVSQALYAGGLAMRPAPPYSGTAAWYMTGGPTTWNPSTTWINAQDNSTFLGSSLPAAKVASYSGVAPGALVASKASQGDVVSYDWDNDGGVDHQAIVVTADGQYVDAHTNNRYHAYWTLAQYNPQWQTTVMTVYHIAPGTK